MRTALSPAEGALRFRARQQQKEEMAPVVARARARARELAASGHFDVAPKGKRSPYGVIRCACGAVRPSRSGRRPFDWKCEACR